MKQDTQTKNARSRKQIVNELLERYEREERERKQVIKDSLIGNMKGKEKRKYQSWLKRKAKNLNT